MPNAMLALPNIRGALCSTPQSFAYAQPCSKAAKTRDPLKLAGPISAVSGPKFILLLNTFFRCEELPGKVARWCVLCFQRVACTPAS